MKFSKQFFQIAFLALAAIPAGATPTTVTVADTLYGPNGQPLSGSITVFNNWTFTAADGTIVPKGTVASAAIVNGAFTIQLVPNAGSNPSGSSYLAEYTISGGTGSFSETWVIPATGPVTLAGVRTSPVPSPSVMFAASQLNPPAGCTNLELLRWTTSGWTCLSAVFPTNAPGIAHEFLSAYNSATGAFSQSQPAFSDLSGTATLAQLPSTLAQYSGSITIGNCAKWSSSGILADAGAACGGVSLSSPNTWTATQSYKPASGDAIDILNGSGGNIGKWDSTGNITFETTLTNLSGSLVLQACSGCNISVSPGSGGSVTIGGSTGAITSGLFTQQATQAIEWGLYSTYNATLVPTTLSANRAYTLPDASGTVCVANAGTSGCGGGVSESTGNQTGLSATSTGTQLVTLVTPSTDTTYRIVVMIGASTAEAGCTTKASLKTYLTWTDPLSGTVQTVTGSAAFAPDTMIVYYASTQSVIMPIVAKGGTAVQAGLDVLTAASICSTYPVLNVYAEALP